MLRRTNDSPENYKKCLNKYFQSKEGNIIWQVFKVDCIGIHIKSITGKRKTKTIIEVNMFRKNWYEIKKRMVKKIVEENKNGD